MLYKNNKPKYLYSLILGISNGDNINQNEIEDNESVKPGKFPWADKIMEILQSSKEHEISIKRLRKKISNEYTLLTGKEVDDKVLSKLNKLLEKNHFKTNKLHRMAGF